ncbi:MAG: hypothetical protein IJ466_08855 [Clostridia bacterium]|nr:hypothetical protein [Clostridia bacterium]
MKKFLIVYFTALILALTGIGIMGWLGYRLLEEGMVFLLFGMLVISALIALAVFVCRKVLNKVLKVAAVGVSGVICLAVGLGMLVVFTIMTEFSVPSYYNSFTAPSGKVAVVLREYSTNEELRAQRPLLNDDGSDFLGLVYKAYPRVAGIFYDSERPGEGELEIGVHSSAQLMYEWTDENTLHLFIENPQAGDTGEHSLNLAE